MGKYIVPAIGRQIIREPVGRGSNELLFGRTIGFTCVGYPSKRRDLCMFGSWGPSFYRLFRKEIQNVIYFIRDGAWIDILVWHTIRFQFSPVFHRSDFV